MTSLGFILGAPCTATRKEIRMTLLDALWDVAVQLPWWVWCVLMPIILAVIWMLIVCAKESLAESHRRFDL